MRKLFFGDYLFFGTAGGYQQVKERLSVIDRCKGLEKCRYARMPLRMA
jgi:hypothetical protein